MIVGKVSVVCLAVGTVLAAGCVHSDPNARSRMDKPRWKSGIEPMADGRLNATLPAEPAILPQTHFAAGRLLEKKGLIPDAIVQYRKAIAVNHEYVEAYHALAVLLSRVGDRQGAVKTMAQAVKIRPDDPVLQNNYGYLLMHVEAWAKAIEQFNAAIEARPFFARAHVNLGLCLSKLGRFQEAFVSFRAVLPEADAHYNMGLMYRGQRRYAEATRSFQRVLEINPSFGAASRQLTEIAPLMQQPATAWMGPPEEIDAGEMPAAPIVTVAQGDADPVLAEPVTQDGFEGMTSSADFWAFQADFDYDQPACESMFLQEAMQAVASVSPTSASGGRQRPGIEGDMSDGPTCPADFERVPVSVDEDILRCEQLYLQEASEAVATASPRSIRATKSMTVDPEAVERVQPVDWGAALSELWEELPPDPDGPRDVESIAFPRERMAFYPGMGFFIDAPVDDYFAGESEEGLMSYADPFASRPAAQCPSYGDPLIVDEHESAPARGSRPEKQTPMETLLEIESRIALERSEQACLEQELGIFSSGLWIDTSVASSAVADIPEIKVRWTTAEPVRRTESKASLASDTMGTGDRDRPRTGRTGSATLGMSIVAPADADRSGGDTVFEGFDPDDILEDGLCPEDSEGVRDPHGASAGSLEYILEIMRMAATEKWCLDAAGLQQMAEPEVIDASPADWDDGGIAERDVLPYERATLGSRVVPPDTPRSDRIRRRARPTPRRYRLGKSTTKGMIEPVRN